MRPFALPAFAAGLLGLGLAFALPAGAAGLNLEWAAGSPGGSWFTQVTGLSTLVMEANPDLAIRVVPGGGKDNPSRIQAGVSQIGMGIDFLAKAAATGSEPYKEPHDKLRSLGGSGIEALFLVYTPDDEKRSLGELLADPKVTIGVTPQATSEYLTLLRALDFYGNSPAKIRAGGGKVVIASYNELVSGFDDGQFDVLWSGGEIPSGIATQVQDGRRKSHLLKFPADLSKNLTDKFGYGRSVIPAATFPKLQTTDVEVSSMGNLYLVSADVSEEAAYRVTKTLIASRDKLKNIYQALDRYDPKVAWKDQPVPLHPGAERAFREAGYLK